jgi:hypothetical protein
MIDTAKNIELQFTRGRPEGHPRSDGSKGEIWRVLGYTKEARAAAETPEAERQRKEKLALNEADRRARSEAIFNEEWWTREQAINWVATRDKHKMERTQGAVLYEPDGSLADGDACRSLRAKVHDGPIMEYPNGRGGVEYRRAQVIAAFPEVGQQSAVMSGRVDAGILRAIRAASHSPGGRASGLSRRKKRTWTGHATELALGQDYRLSDDRIASEVEAGWKITAGPPGHRTLVRHVADLRSNGTIKSRNS